MKDRRVVQVILTGMVLLLQCTASGLNAQVASGTIVGIARDSSGAILPGVNITCKSVETGAVRNVIAGERGA